MAGGADTAVAALRAVPLAVVLDGLEVLQELQADHAGLVLLISRFPFQDLTTIWARACGCCRWATWHRRAARLLASLGAEGSVDEREEVSRRLEGHPLALRVFAAALAPAAS